MERCRIILDDVTACPQWQAKLMGTVYSSVLFHSNIWQGGVGALPDYRIWKTLFLSHGAPPYLMGLRHPGSMLKSILLGVYYDQISYGKSSSVARASHTCRRE